MKLRSITNKELLRSLSLYNAHTDLPIETDCETKRQVELDAHYQLMRNIIMYITGVSKGDVGYNTLIDMFCSSSNIEKDLKNLQKVTKCNSVIRHNRGVLC